MPRFDDGFGGAPSAGIPSSTGAISQYATQYGVPLGGSPAQGRADDLSQLLLWYGTKTRPASVGPLSSLSKADKMPTIKGDKTMSAAEAQQKFIASGKDNIKRYAMLLSLAGYGNAGNGDLRDVDAFVKNAPLQDVLGIHEQFLKDAAGLYSKGQKITPSQYLKMLIDFRLSTMGVKWDGNLKTLSLDTLSKLNSGTETKTQTSRSVDLMSPTDAKALVRGMLQQELGRDPTQAEYEDFVATIHSAERRNPTISSTTYTTDGEGNVSSSTTSHGGLTQAGADQAVYEKLRKQPAWSEWQAVGTYAPALFEALGTPISGV